MSNIVPLVGPGLPGRMTPTAWELPDGLPFDRWLAIGEMLKYVEQALLWWIGDWLRYGEGTYGEMYAQALEATDYSYSALSTAKSIAEKFEFCRRRQNLSFAHHAEVSSLPAVQQDELLDCAANRGWSHKELRAEVHRIKNLVGAAPSGDTCRTDDLHALIAAGNKFGTIYADPPWLYGNQATRASTSNHYGGMTADEIAALPISDLAAPDAHLHLWTTNGFLFDAPSIMAAWGFEYKSCFVWVKPGIGTGNYWRLAHEFLLFGVRGSAPFRDRGLISWGNYDRGNHSSKPEQVRGLIERASPGPRLELFARQVAVDWTVWGNNIERNLMHSLAREVA